MHFKYNNSEQSNLIRKFEDTFRAKKLKIKNVVADGKFINYFWIKGKDGKFYLISNFGFKVEGDHFKLFNVKKIEHLDLTNNVRRDITISDLDNIF